MSDETKDLPIIEAQGLRVSEASETEAHARRGPAPSKDVAETEAHARRSPAPSKDVAETEAHARRSPAPSKDVAETEAHASLRISFPPHTDEQTLTIVYRPAANPGDEPEVELHRAYASSDARLKRDITTA